MKKSKTKYKNNLIFTRETLGMTVLLFCLIVFIALLSGKSVFADFGGAICTLMYGTFGYGCFFVVALFACLGVWLTFGRRIKLKFLPAMFLSLTVYMLFLLIHAIFTNSEQWQTDGYTISNYIAECYLLASEGFPYYTFGGVVSAIFVYPVARITTYVGAYIIFSILALLCGYFTVVFFKKYYGKVARSGSSEGAALEYVEQPSDDGQYSNQYVEPEPKTEPVQEQYGYEDYDYSQHGQQFASPSYSDRYSAQSAPQPQSILNSRHEFEQDDDRFAPSKLGRQILLGGDFAAESYRRNGIFDENSYFNHPINNNSDYMRGFSDGKSSKPTDYGTTYSSVFEQSVDSQLSSQHSGILYGDTPTEKLGDGKASSYTAPESVHNYKDDDSSEDITDYTNSVYDAPETEFNQSPEGESEVKVADDALEFASSNPYDITRKAAPLLEEESTFARGEQIFGAGQKNEDSGKDRDIFGAESDISHEVGDRHDRRDFFGSDSQIPSEGVGRRDRFDMFGTSSSRVSATDSNSTSSRSVSGDGLSEAGSFVSRDSNGEMSRGNSSESLSSLFSSPNQVSGENRIKPDVSRLPHRESRANVFDDSLSSDSDSQSFARGEEVSSERIRGGREFIAPESELSARQHDSMSELPSKAVPAPEVPSRAMTSPTNGAVSATATPAEKKPHVWKKYVRPSLDLLDDYLERTNSDSVEIENNKRIIVETLQSFKIDCEISEVIVAPALTRYDVTIFDRTNIKTSLLKYKDPIAMALKRDNVNAYLNFSKGALSIEVPNAKRTIVGLKSIMFSSSFNKAKSNTLTFALGKNLDGACICPDIKKMPHLLVAGTTGSGKSICLSSLLISLLYKYGPEDLRLILVDPKQVEFISYDKLPHLMINEIIFDVDKAIKALNWAIKEMERRYTMFKEMTETGARTKDGAKTATKDIDEYNAHIANGEEKLPKILIVLDEFGDLMLSAKKDIEGRIIRLVQKGRAAGIHLILATQRPSVDCITGLIKSNLDARIGFKVGSYDDSRTIFDVGGAEKLLGKGDMYFRSKEYAEGKMQRIQGCFVDTPEVQRVTDFIKANNETYFDQSISDFINTVEEPEGSSSLTDGGDSYEDTKIDDTFLRALKYCVSSNAASVSMIQRRFPIGYIKACKIVDWMEKMNYITASEGSKSRKVLMSMEEFVNKYGEVDD